MEVVLLSRYYEGFADSVRELQHDGELREVTRGFCGV
jgi:hypothetical protein